MSIPTIGPRGGAGSSDAQPVKEPVTNADVIRVLGFLILLGTVGLPLTIFLWKLALS